MTTVAIMQPYFVPYAGYFRLFAAADLFIIYDCVQFPRRGWVHRNRLPDRTGRPAWLTLPVAKAPREATIDALTLRDDFDAQLDLQRRRFPTLASSTADEILAAPRGSLVTFLAATLTQIARMLNVGCETIRSSTLGVAPHLRGQDRILAIVEAVGGKRYVNAPGGRHLYDAATFERRGVRLDFLSPFEDADGFSVLHRLVTEGPDRLGRDVRRQTRLS